MLVSQPEIPREFSPVDDRDRWFTLASHHLVPAYDTRSIVLAMKSLVKFRISLLEI